MYGRTLDQLQLNVSQKFAAGVLIDTSRKIYEMEQKLQSTNDKIDALVEKMDQLFMYHPVIGSEIPHLSTSFAINANKSVE
jgi:hypothetical protein